ncbi:hypothetical protein GLAREA_09441 [Glarea lozoyensis ATCC 20868]|uniref:Uncharacterized protein n=1 Tax=Glarea lozoyensis (strain ATCC 20868 / MF5171) TaxID=1116229 RepID=S3D8K0_GLAL2|nr:uncharacterized protein GLAREA_09441 [Glarea lozoyensis ATCC 20868]EPE28321.1 hypothetical protein GLAREA_09441 [Glarea lozoyensis ATCC 20868]
MPFNLRKFFRSCFGTAEETYEPVRVLPHPVHGYVGETLTPREKDTLAFINSHRPNSRLERDESIRTPHMPRLRPHGTVIHRPLEADHTMRRFILNKYAFQD